MRTSPALLLLAAASLAACRSSEPEEEETPLVPDAGAVAETTQDEGALDPDDPLQREFEELTLAEQKRAFLVETHIQRAKELREALRLEEAEMELARALELDPDNLEAKRLFAQVGALLNREPGRLQTIQDQLAGDYELRIQQLEAEARDHVRQAKVFLGRGEYEDAITELTLARDNVRFSPTIDWEGLDQEIEELLATARRERAEALEADRIAAQQQALEELRAQETAERARQQAILNNMLEQAIEAFEAGEYDDAIAFAEQALDEDPRNERALDIRDSAFRAGRDQFKERTLAMKREQYKEWQEELDELMIPYVDVITLPDGEFWREITELRGARRGLDLGGLEDPADVALRQRLRTTFVPGFEFTDEESLIAVASGLATISGLPIVVDPLAEEAAIDEGVVFDIQLTNPITVERALQLITDLAGPEVTWTIRHEAVLITTREKARGDLVIYNHVVDDLIFGLTDFMGPKIDRLRLLDELEDDDGGGPFGGIGERPTIIEPDDLVALVQENVAVDTWEDEGVSITIEGGSMIVVHTPEVQREVRDFLEDLRRFSSSLVTIESKFLTVADNFLQEIGVEWRGLDNPGDPFTALDDVTNGLEDMASLGLDNLGPGVDEDAAGPPSAGFFYDDGEDGDFKGHISHLFGEALGQSLSNVGGFTLQYTFLNDLQASAILRMIEKRENIELLNDQVLSVHNTQRAFVTAINQRAYVQDFDVEVAQFEAIADPQINVLEEGIVLDVRPTIHHDRKYLTLEIQPTVANVVSLQDFSTTLGGQTQAVTFQLPELEVQSVFTTAVVPDGGSILLGGLSRIRNIERRAEVPWIANVPLVGFFFKEEGYSDERSSLMIMIRAWITDVKRELARLEARR